MPYPRYIYEALSGGYRDVSHLKGYYHDSNGCIHKASSEVYEALPWKYDTLCEVYHTSTGMYHVTITSESRLIRGMWGLGLRYIRTVQMCHTPHWEYQASSVVHNAYSSDHNKLTGQYKNIAWKKRQNLIRV